ncbi:hypothetical protein [Arthrobacter woluwensis]|uniref:hypothetical protein n=1 Tax=Arthrobacter woluwensis TaxID=156980 RepID=UPI001AAEB920|nr:hypothetical protein [Arthrobacter woluwensis]QTF71243.1 hypothetical protein G8758_03905 [Arthrobacter woluwensis]
MTGLASLVDGRFYTPSEVGEEIGVKPFTVRSLCRTNPEFCTRLERNKIALTKAQATALFNHLANKSKPDRGSPGYDPFA